MVTMGIIEFLTARLDEAEERATYAQTVISGSWDGWEPIAHQLAADCDTVPNVGRLDQHLHHNADPARVLAEVKAKRAIIAMHEQAEKWTWDPRPAGTPVREPRREPAGHCGTCQIEDGVIHGKWPCDTLKHLAAVYADHPDFDPAWRVQ